MSPPAVPGEVSSSSSSATNAAPSPDLLSDCRTMLRFALKEGLVIPDDLQQTIGELDRILVVIESSNPISAIPAEFIKASSIQGDADVQPEKATPSISLSALVLKVHAALSRVVAPATALTLQASEPPPGKRYFFGGMPTLVKAAALTATLSAFGFVATSILPVAKDAATQAASATSPAKPTPVPSATPTP